MVVSIEDRIFAKINIVDITAIIIVFLAIFIAIYFVFLRPVYIHYEPMEVMVSFVDIPLNDLLHFSEGEYALDYDNESYLVVMGNNPAVCSDKQRILFFESKNVSCSEMNETFFYYFNNSYIIYAERIHSAVVEDNASSCFGVNETFFYYLNNSYFPYKQVNYHLCFDERCNKTVLNKPFIKS